MKQYEWGADARELLERRQNSDAKTGFDVVIGADCVYAETSVEPLFNTLCQVMHAQSSHQQTCLHSVMVNTVVYWSRTRVIVLSIPYTRFR